MGIASIIIGVMLILIAFIARKRPESLSGYNTMSKEKLSNIDMAAISRIMFRGCLIIGIAVIVVYYLFVLLNLRIIADTAVILIPLIGVFILMIKSSKFDRNKRKNSTIAAVILIVMTVLIAGLLIYGYTPTEMTVKEDTVSFSGMYGRDINAADIEDIRVSPNIPRVIMRSNGMSFAGSNKGWFQIEEYGGTMLYSNSKYTGPYLIITTANGGKIIYKTKDVATGMELYGEVLAAMESRME